MRWPWQKTVSASAYGFTGDDGLIVTSITVTKSRFFKRRAVHNFSPPLRIEKDQDALDVVNEILRPNLKIKIG